MDLGFGGMEALTQLLKPDDHKSDEDDDMPQSQGARLGPGDIGPVKQKSTGDAPAQNQTIKKKDPKDIWGEDEVAEGGQYDDTLDPRPAPDYDISYKQSVTSEDIYLGMGGKTPATASCEDMVVRVRLPHCKMADVNLNVQKTFLDCRTSKYRLGLHLPHPVNDKSGKAQWDGKSETLIVTLRMIREYDLLNF